MFSDKYYKFLFVSLIFSLSSCGSLVVEDEKDSGPPTPLDVSHIEEPVPKEEPRTAAGNISPYKVFGKSYHIMEVPEGYRERGVASWYGKKFHGRKTSNGEIYNMYGMTAAHKTLPIPSYVRVTNVADNASVIVRVNDRGPFHGDRLVDLTYTAAKKLGFANRGTAEVLVEYIDPGAYRRNNDANSVSKDTVKISTGEPKAPTPVNVAGYGLPENTFLQVGAFSKESSANTLQAELSKMTPLAVVIVFPEKKQNLFRVQVGPFLDNLELLLFRKRLIEASYPIPHVVYQ